MEVLPLPFLKPLLLFQVTFLLCGCINVPYPKVPGHFLPEVPRGQEKKVRACEFDAGYLVPIRIVSSGELIQGLQRPVAPDLSPS